MLYVRLVSANGGEEGSDAGKLVDRLNARFAIRENTNFVDGLFEKRAKLFHRDCDA